MSQCDGTKKKLLFMYPIISGSQRGRENKYMQRGWRLHLVVNAFHSLEPPSQRRSAVRQTETWGRGGENTPHIHTTVSTLSCQFISAVVGQLNKQLLILNWQFQFTLMCCSYRACCYVVHCAKEGAGAEIASESQPGRDRQLWICNDGSYRFDGIKYEFKRQSI